MWRFLNLASGTALISPWVLLLEAPRGRGRRRIATLGPPIVAAAFSGGHGPPSSLGAKARISAVVDVSFGLGIGVLAMVFGNSFNFVHEVLMNNANAVVACVWCGVAFLRGPGG